MLNLIQEINKDALKSDCNHFKVGDGVHVHTRVKEGDKERIQVFSGIVIARRGSGIHESFTVRRMISGEGVERVFPVHSPTIAKVEVERKSVVTRRAKLFYIRKLVGKRANKVKTKDSIHQLKSV